MSNNMTNFQEFIGYARYSRFIPELGRREHFHETVRRLTDWWKERAELTDKEAEELIQEYIKQGEEAKIRIIEAAESTAVKLEEQAKRHIEHEFEQAKTELQAEILQKALGKAEEIITAKINDEDQHRLVDEYLEKVVA